MLIGWHTIKELEKKYLHKKFSRIQTTHIKAIGIDEIHIGKGMKKTIIPDHCLRFTVRCSYSCRRGKGHFSPCQGFEKVKEKQIEACNNEDLSEDAKLDEIVTYWTFRYISNAKMEGFNNKIGWLIKQAYGFRVHEYFKLKIYQLLEISSEKSL